MLGGMSNIKKTTGKNIRRYRNELGISQEKLAELSDLHRTYVGAIERGERNVSIVNLEKIALALKVETAKLLKPIKK